MSLANSISDSIRSKIERFDKLYRILYRDYMFKDFIHKDDVLRMFNEIHERITLVQTNMNTQMSAAIAGSNAAVLGHTHPVQVSPLSGTGATIGSVNAAPVPPAVPSAAPLIPWAEPKHIARLEELVLQGPATAPFAEGFSLQTGKANLTIRTDIGV